MRTRILAILLIVGSVIPAGAAEPVGEIVFLRYIRLPYGPQGDGTPAAILRLTNRSQHPITYFGLSLDVPMYLVRRQTKRGWSMIRQDPFTGGGTPQRLEATKSTEFAFYAPRISSSWRIGIPYTLEPSIDIDQPSNYKGPFLWSSSIPKPPNWAPSSKKRGP